MKKKVLVVLVMVSLLVAVCGTVFATDITSTGNQITISNSATTGNSINITTTNTHIVMVIIHMKAIIIACMVIRILQKQVQ